MFNVSTKTISRWRQQGLVSRRFVFDGRKRVGFLAELGRPVRGAQRRARAPRCAVQPTYRRRARRDHRAGPAPGAAPAAARPRSRGAWPSGWDAAWKRFATRSSSSTRSIRSWRSFPNRTGPLTEDDKKKIYQQYRRGVLGRDAGQALLPHQDQHLSRDQRGAGPADHGAAAGFHSEPACSAEPSAEKAILGPMPAADAPAEEGAAAQRACRRIWRACTRCRCSLASRKRTCSASSTT